MMVFLLTYTLSNTNLIIKTDEIIKLSNLTLTNLIPATIFLYLLEFDFKSLWKFHTIGCACNIGTKRYWILIILALFVSFLTQIIAQNITDKILFTNFWTYKQNSL